MAKEFGLLILRVALESKLSEAFVSETQVVSIRGELRVIGVLIQVR